tara:strand:- start:2907 stop:3116 length:210 start_codon:yes stop_codon:yes gene_type:complete
MGGCTSKQTKKTIKLITENEEFRSLVYRLYYETILDDDGELKETDEKLKKIQTEFQRSSYIDDLLLRPI